MTKTLLKPESTTVLNGVRWETYQGLALDLGENPSKKLTYDQFIYCLEEGGYKEHEFSQVLPILSKSLILRFLKRRG